MSSFYAGIMNSGGVGPIPPGGIDYDTLKDVPISNVGTENTTTVLSGLDVGHYNLKGKYKAKIGDEAIDNSSSLDVLVFKDLVTGQRVVHFLTVEDGEVFMNLFAYAEDGTLIQQDKVSLTYPTPSWGTI